MWLPTAISQALPALCIAAASGDRCTVKDAGWVAFTTTWKGPPRERRADAAADLREQLKVERPAYKAEGARVFRSTARSTAIAVMLLLLGECGWCEDIPEACRV
jgi:hypothetical protein